MHYNGYKQSNYYFTSYFYPHYRVCTYPMNENYYCPENEMYFNRQDNVRYSDGIISLQNSANTKWKYWNLDIDGKTGEVILWDHLASGGYWKLTNHNDGTVSLQNTANTKWKNWYLDIDGNTGKVILWDHLASGGYWKLTNHSSTSISLQNTANTKWKNWYLDIDGNTGEVILWDHLGSGGYWNLTNHGVEPKDQPTPNTKPSTPGRLENLIKRISYDEPYSKTCYKKVLNQNIPYPCVGMQTKVIEIYLVTRYPEEATPIQKAAIINCAEIAVGVAYTAFWGAYSAAVAATAGTAGIILGVAAGISAAEIAGRNSFDNCKRKSLPLDIDRKTGIGIEQKKFNRSSDSYEPYKEYRDYYNNINQTYSPYDPYFAHWR